MSTTTSSAAQALGINPRTLRRWTENGYVRRYGRDRYDADDVAVQWNRLAHAGHFADPDTQTAEGL